MKTSSKKKAVNCHFCCAGGGKKEEREMCCLWAGTAPGKPEPALEQSVSGRAKFAKGFFHPKALFRSFRRAVRKESIVLRSWLVPLPSDQLDSKAEHGIPTWISLLWQWWAQELQLPGVFWKGESFVLENKPRLCQTREEGISPEPHLGRFCTFLGTNFSCCCQRQLTPPGPGSGAPTQRFVPSCGNDIPRGGKRFCQK